MRNVEILEGSNRPIIVVDVQPEYSGMNDGDESPVFPEIINFVNNQTGPVLMFVNAERDGLTGDDIAGIKQYWQETVWEQNPEAEINWNRFTVVDKGYGYFRSWMDNNISPATIIKVIRMLYSNRVTDSRDLFGGEDAETYEEQFQKMVGNEFMD